MNSLKEGVSVKALKRKRKALFDSLTLQRFNEYIAFANERSTVRYSSVRDADFFPGAVLLT